MRKLKIIEHISLDGVIQHSADDNDFPYSDWTAPYRSPAGREAITAAHGESFDLLLGRRTYDIWSGFWPKAPRSPMADGLNAAKKYIATHRPVDAVSGSLCRNSVPHAAVSSGASLRELHVHDQEPAVGDIPRILFEIEIIVLLLLEHGFRRVAD